VNRARDGFLSCSGLTVDQHGRIGWSDDFDLLQDVAKRLRLADDLAKVQLGSDLVLEVDLLATS